MNKKITYIGNIMVKIGFNHDPMCKHEDSDRLR